MTWNRLFVYRNMVNDIVLDSVMYINKAKEPDPEYWSEELLKIMEKAESDSQLNPNERNDIITLIEKANEQLNIKLSTTVKTEGADPNDYTRLEQHLPQKMETVEVPRQLQTEEEILTQKLMNAKVVKGQKPQGPLANFSPPPPTQVQGPVLGDLTKGPIGSSGKRMIDGVPIENFLKDPNKSRLNKMR